MTLLLKDSGQPDRNQYDPRVQEGELGIIYGFPKDSNEEILNGLEVTIKEAMSNGFFLVDVDGLPQEHVIHHKNLMHLDVEDIIVIDNYDK